MTTVMLIAAMVPIALGRGPGAESRASLAKVVLGGQTLSLLLTLLVTPVAYSLWEDLRHVTNRVIGSFRRKVPQFESLPAVSDRIPEQPTNAAT